MIFAYILLVVVSTKMHSMGILFLFSRLVLYYLFSTIGDGAAGAEGAVAPHLQTRGANGIKCPPISQT